MPSENGSLRNWKYNMNEPFFRGKTNPARNWPQALGQRTTRTVHRLVGVHGNSRR